MSESTDKPKRDQRNRWPIECPDNVRAMIRAMAGKAGVGAEKMAGAILTEAVTVAYAEFLRGESAKLPHAKPKPHAKPPRPR